MLRLEDILKTIWSSMDLADIISIIVDAMSVSQLSQKLIRPEEDRLSWPSGLGDGLQTRIQEFDSLT